MKYIFLLLTVLSSCSFYVENREIIVAGVNNGTIVITSSDYYEKISRSDDSDLILYLSKGDTYYISFYPDFYGKESRFPYGAIIDLTKDFITVSPHLGILTEQCNNINISGNEIDFEVLSYLSEKFLQCEDPWIFIQDDIRLALLGEIGRGSISKWSLFDLSELDEYYNWFSENRLFNYWYPSIQSFYKQSENCFYRLQIFEDRSYIGFEETK